MENRTELGMNRTGIQMAPAQMKKMEEVTELTVPPPGDDQGMAEIRQAYIAQADPLGTVPPPATMKGVASTTINMMKGKRAHVFIDKLAERLAFERGGVRLYEALITKCEAPHDGPDVVPVARLRHFQQEEAEHFALVMAAIEKLGADPTVQTPCADVTGVESMGLMQVITDPKTTVNQSLHAILVAELTDAAAWEELVMLAREMGQEEMAEQFEEAAATEAEHLDNIKRWHAEATLAETRVVAKH